jgi:hypothetical protein
MFRVKHLKDGKLSFDGTMNTEDVKKLNGMDKLITYLLTKNESFYLIMGLGNEEWNIFYTIGD